MVRTPAPKIGRPTPIQPVAQPVSTYVRPPEPAQSSLRQLAEGLAAFDSGMRGWLDKKEAEQAEADAIRGEAAFNRNNQVGWAEGVRSGAIPAHASPIFMEAYKKAQGEAMGVRMREQFNLEYAQWEGRNSNDPEAFTDFLDGFVTRHYQAEDDPDILAGFNPHVEALRETAYTTWSTDRANTIYNGHLDTRAALVGVIIDNASQQGIALETGTDYDAMREDILAQRQEALGSGIRMADYDKELVATIAAKAIEHGDPELLQLLEDTLPGYEVALSSLPDFRDVKATTEAALIAEYRRRQEADAKRQQAEDKAAENRITTEVYRVLWEDPSVEIPEETLREWEKYNPEARKKLVDARKSLSDGLTMEDPQDLITIERAIQAGATTDDIFELAANGVIKDPATFKSLIDRIQQRQEAGAQILTTQTAKRYLATIKERTANLAPEAAFAPDGLTDEGIEATSYFEQMLIEWRMAHPEATLFEQDQFTKQAAEQVLERIVGDELEAPEFISPADEEALRAEEADLAEQEAAQREAVAREAAAAAKLAGATEQEIGSEVGRQFGSMVAPPAPDEETIQLYGQDAPPSLSSMDATSRQLIEQQSEVMGITPDEYNRIVWEETRRSLGLSTEYTPPAPGPQSSLTNTNARSPEAASEALAYFQSNPQAVRIDPSQIVDMTPTTSGNWNFGKLSQPNALVIHHTAGRGGVDGVIQTFKERGYPAHFVIDRDGTIHRILADDQKGQHTRPAQDGSGITNSNSWGVEIIANDDSDLTPKQVEASIQLAYYLHDNYQMPLDRVVGHGQINDHKQETEGATVLAALSELAKGGNPNDNIAEPAGLSPQRGVEPLLAFIAQEEGTGGSYNMVYGGREQPLTDMTISQVRQIGKAVGKYQMMPATLGDAQQALGLSPDTKFTPEVQEQIVMWLLQRRGLSDWQAGQMSTERFVDNLAMEWAALSTSSGKAHYEGQGADASLEGLLAALNQTT